MPIIPSGCITSVTTAAGVGGWLASSTVSRANARLWLQGQVGKKKQGEHGRMKEGRKVEGHNYQC